MNISSAPEVTHAAVLLQSDRHWLLQLRDEKPDIIQPGAISLWGGERHKYESPSEAAARELLEETDIQVEHDELELITVLQYKETKLKPPDVVEHIDAVSAVFLARRAYIPPFDVQEGQGLLYMPLARLFKHETDGLRTTQELDLTINHLKEISHRVVAEALEPHKPKVEATVNEEDFITHWGLGAADIFTNFVRAIAHHPDFPLQPSAKEPMQLDGDIDLAIQWLVDNYRGPYKPSYHTILERIRSARLNLAQD